LRGAGRRDAKSQPKAQLFREGGAAAGQADRALTRGLEIFFAWR